ncbi:MAG: [FeFe] hydrogenase H-cluster maturation GTPase HydF [Synergistaceae bacterium]|nr:[FeFe] hydrogenase H-cluster maturation GTPase HydF [Synergistaceae bacterium]
MSSLNDTPRGERLHIGIFGKRNAGKSSLLNAITGQAAAVVSPVKGTTTDPVFKAMELLPIGPVVLIDTPGIDDYGELGELRTEKTKDVLRKTNIALLVVDTLEGLADEDAELIKTFEEMGVKYLVVYNKSDLAGFAPAGRASSEGFFVSAVTGENIGALKEKIAQLSGPEAETRRLTAGLLSPGDVVVLVVPIDSAAPKGRLILPQQQVIRDVLDTGAVSVVTQPAGLADTLKKLNNPPSLVITDSQAFGQVAKETPGGVRLTSFSILMARCKGSFEQAVRGVKALDAIKDGDKILISEGCTHHKQCDDIGTVKIPRWIEKHISHTGAKPVYEFSSGGGFPHDLSNFKMIIHCGGCMLNNREMLYRCRAAEEAGVPMTNYGVAISHMEGILERCIAPFSELEEKLRQA